MGDVKAELSKDEMAEYCRAIELHWSLRCENQIIVSPTEYGFMVAWFDAGIPCEVVCRAIDRHLERRQKRRGKRPVALGHVNDQVLRMFEEYKSLHAGEDQQARDGLQTRVGELMRALNRLVSSHPEAEAVVLEAAQRVSALTGDAWVAFDDVESALSRIEDDLVRWFEAQLAEDERLALEEDLASLTDADEPQELVLKLRRDMVRYHFGIPRLSILG